MFFFCGLLAQLVDVGAGLFSLETKKIVIEYSQQKLAESS